MFRVTFQKRSVLLTILLVTSVMLAGQTFGQQSGKEGQSPADNLPSHITRLTYFGQRADWSHDGKRILFIEKTFGDVYEVEISTKIIHPVTHHYFHEGYTRALYLANGDILLSGARTFDAKNPWPSRGENAELWILDKSLKKPPVPLGTKCSEGPAVSRKKMRIAWTIDHGDYPDKLADGVSQMWMADIEYVDGTPKLVNRKLVLDSSTLPFKCGLETQNFRPPDEKELIFSAYGYQDTEVMGIDLETGKVVNYSEAPDQYDEPEGILPDGKWTLVECDRAARQKGLKGSQYIDIWKLRLDGSHTMERVTYFSDYPGYKATNPVVSDDGRYMAFQMAKVGDPAGVGRGIFLRALTERPQSNMRMAGECGGGHDIPIWRPGRARRGMLKARANNVFRGPTPRGKLNRKESRARRPRAELLRVVMATVSREGWQLWTAVISV